MVMTHSPGIDLIIFVKVSRDNTLRNDQEPR